MEVSVHIMALKVIRMEWYNEENKKMTELSGNKSETARICQSWHKNILKLFTYFLFIFANVYYYIFQTKRWHCIYFVYFCSNTLVADWYE